MAFDKSVLQITRTQLLDVEVADVLQGRLETLERYEAGAYNASNWYSSQPDIKIHKMNGADVPSDAPIQQQFDEDTALYHLRHAIRGAKDATGLASFRDKVEALMLDEGFKVLQGFMGRK
jgi:hypothetical protein